ncbi:MAG: hypothetical protein ACKV2V_02575 [Blastocatellia bacterium]
MFSSRAFAASPRGNDRRIHSAKPFLLILCGLLLFAPLAQTASAISRHVPLEEMTTGAGRIVHGRVADSRPGTHPQYSHIAVTFVTLEVIDMIRGNAARQVTFMQFGAEAARSGGASHNFHLPRYLTGEEVVLFLYPESQYGFTSPVGEGQGKFLVSHDARTGRPALMNDRGNRDLFTALRTEKMQTRLRLSSAERSLVTQQGGALDLEHFRSLVRKMATDRTGVATH